MRLRSRPYLHYAPVPGGVYLSGARNQFVLRGPEQLLTVVDRCVPLLEAGTTEDELVASLGTERIRPVVQRLTAALGDHDMLMDVDRLTVSAPPDEDRLRYAESLAYLESVVDDPYAVFARVRAATVLLSGPPTAVLPAARGLARAGVGTILLASRGRLAVRSVTDLGAEVRAVTDHEMASLVAAVDAVVACADDAGSTGPASPVGPGGGWSVPTGSGVLVPVRLGSRVALIGPAIEGRQASNGAGRESRTEAVHQRMISWAEAEHVDLAARPSADALAGAMAGQLVFDLLAGASPGAAGQVHVVYGGELSAETLVLPAPPPESSALPAGWRRLDQAASTPVPGIDACLDHVQTLSARWSGLFALVPETRLAQLPLALRVAEHRAGGSGPLRAVVGWAETQQVATIAATLEILRGQCDATRGVAAAGLTEQHWLLDGALRLLARDARVVAEFKLTEPAPDAIAETAHSGTVLRPRAYQTWQALIDDHPQALAVQLCQVPGLDWRLARICNAGNAILGAAWGRDGAEAVEGALAAALARLQVAAVPVPVDHRPCTNALLTADEPTIAALRRQVCAYPLRYRGQPVRTDPVLGALPMWFGPVETYRPPAGPTGEPSHG